ncbi:MAG: hypothetical protein AAFS13_09690 [Pseudomonadota bacterium]
MFQSKEAQIAALTAAVNDALGSQDWLDTAQIDENGRATLILKADADDLPASEKRRQLAEEAARSVPGLSHVSALMTAERQRTGDAPQPPSGTQRVRRGAKLSEQAMRDGAPRQSMALDPIPGIRRIIAVASAKGGVGKSTFL